MEKIKSRLSIICLIVITIISMLVLVTCISCNSCSNDEATTKFIEDTKNSSVIEKSTEKLTNETTTFLEEVSATTQQSTTKQETSSLEATEKAETIKNQIQTMQKETTTVSTTKPVETTTAKTETVTTAIQTSGKNPFEIHGKLKVSGTKLVDKNGKAVQLKGASTHGIAWFPQYVSNESFKELRDNFGANVVRIAMYTAEYNGYCAGGNKEELKKLVKKGVDEATKLGMYVIVDWHILSDGNPNTNKSEAMAFFKEISSAYKSNDNILYEICNEPNGGVSWGEVKSYAEEIIPIIRANDKDAVIIVGTPTWSQDVDEAAKNKITGYDNIMYSLHFYAATHKEWIRNKAQTALDSGLALFVTEFSICDASGNGALDKAEAKKWMDFLNKNGISYVGWNLANKDESSSIFKSSCSKLSGFNDNDLSDWGIWLKSTISGK